MTAWALGEHEGHLACHCTTELRWMRAVSELVRGREPDTPVFKRGGEADAHAPPVESAALAIVSAHAVEQQRIIAEGYVSTKRQAFAVARARALSQARVFAVLHARLAQRCPAHDPLTRAVRTFAEDLPHLQGTGPLVLRCTASTRRRLAGDFQLGPLRHDGRWHLNIVDGDARLMSVDVGRRLARRIGMHALEIHLGISHGGECAARGLRDVSIDERAQSYSVTARARASPHMRLSVDVARSGLVDWLSACGLSAQAARRPGEGVAAFDSTFNTVVDRAS